MKTMKLMNDYDPSFQNVIFLLDFDCLAAMKVRKFDPVICSAPEYAEQYDFIKSVTTNSLSDYQPWVHGMGVCHLSELTTKHHAGFAPFKPDDEGVVYSFVDGHDYWFVWSNINSMVNVFKFTFGCPVAMFGFKGTQLTVEACRNNVNKRNSKESSFSSVEVFVNFVLEDTVA